MKADIPEAALAELISGFGERLRTARIAAGYRKQSDFAKQINVSVYRYNNWEQGRHPPGPHYLALLKQRFGISSDWILSGDYLSLSVRLLQQIVNLGAAPDAPEPAREIRRGMPEMTLPIADTPRRMLHEPQAPLHGRKVRHPEN
jgi:transcriptional regulator with XRE-family HTH domain